MNKPKNDETFSNVEAARRRDEVIRRMANTPPQPRVTPHAPAKAAKEAAAGRGLSRKKQARHAASSEQD